jgi:hypothetical protein
VVRLNPGCWRSRSVSRWRARDSAWCSMKRAIPWGANTFQLHRCSGR